MYLKIEISISIPMRTFRDFVLSTSCIVVVLIVPAIDVESF